MNIPITQNGPGDRALKTGGPAAGAVYCIRSDQIRDKL